MTTASISFSENIRPLFRESDRDAMEAWFDLWALEDVRDNGTAILERLEEESMPCDEPWPKERIALFRQWLRSGGPE